jgi:hypothetical protein
MYVTLPDALFLGQAVTTGLLGPMGLVQPLPPLVCKSAIYSSTSELLVWRGLLKGNMHAEASVTKSQLRRRVSSAMLMVLQIRQDKEWRVWKYRGEQKAGRKARDSRDTLLAQLS